MATEDSLENRFNKHPETSTNGNTSLDDDFIYILQQDPELGNLINKDIDKSRDPASIYTKIIPKLSLFEPPEIKKILTSYVSSKFWRSLSSEKQSEFIDNVLSIQEEKEQKGLEKIGVYKARAKSDIVAQGKPKKIHVPFDVVADRILHDLHIFTMRDNKQIYLYKDGVYRSEGSEAILDTKIRDVHIEIYRNSWNDINLYFPLNHIPKATARYVKEVLDFIKAYTHIKRESIEEVQSRYINFKNCLFNIEKFRTGAHNPEILTICQLPVRYDKEAECKRIKNFLKSIVAEQDIDLLCEIAGYCLTTDCSQQKAFMIYGVGSNGKSVFLAVLEALLGSENTSAESLQKLESDK